MSWAANRSRLELEASTTSSPNAQVGESDTRVRSTKRRHNSRSSARAVSTYRASMSATILRTNGANSREASAFIPVRSSAPTIRRVSGSMIGCP